MGIHRDSLLKGVDFLKDLKNQFIQYEIIEKIYILVSASGSWHRAPEPLVIS